jgi:chloramphenicol O-acetyltransferase type A
VDNFRRRIVDGAVWRYTQINAGSAVGRANGTIGMGHYPFRPRIDDFVRKATKELDRVRQRGDIERYPEANLIRYSEPPWFDAEGAEPAHIDHCIAFVERVAHALFINRRRAEGTQSGKKNLARRRLL